MDDDGPQLTIGDLASRAGLPVRTIRFWSDTGALPPAARTSSGRRLYDPACLARLELIVTLRQLGFGLADVRRVLECAGQSRRSRRRILPMQPRWSTASLVKSPTLAAPGCAGEDDSFDPCCPALVE